MFVCVTVCFTVHFSLMFYCYIKLVFKHVADSCYCYMYICIYYIHIHIAYIATTHKCSGDSSARWAKSTAPGWLIRGGEDTDRRWPPGSVYLNPLARLSPYVSGIATNLALDGSDSCSNRAVWRFLDLAAILVLIMAAFVGQKPEPAPSFMHMPLCCNLLVIFETCSAGQPEEHYGTAGSLLHNILIIEMRYMMVHVWAKHIKTQCIVWTRDAP